MHVSPHQCSERLAARLFHPLASKFSRLLPRMGLRRPFLHVSRQHYAALSRNAHLVRFVKAPNPYIRASRPFLADNGSDILLCAFQEALLLKARTDDDSDSTRQRMWETSSEIRKRQRLRRPLPIGCAGRYPSRAIFFTVTGLILRNRAASSGVTNGSLSSAVFTILLRFKPVLTLRRPHPGFASLRASVMSPSVPVRCH